MSENDQVRTRRTVLRMAGVGVGGLLAAGSAAAAPDSDGLQVGDCVVTVERNSVWDYGCPTPVFPKIVNPGMRAKVEGYCEETGLVLVDWADDDAGDDWADPDILARC